MSHGISVKRECLICKKCFTIGISRVKRGNGLYCSRICFIKSRKGNGHPLWTGGKFIGKDGYVNIYVPGYKRKYRFEHILIMENYLGRKIKIPEIVHHNNGNKTDNRIENLSLFPGQSEHLKFHLELEKFLGINRYYKLTKQYARRNKAINSNKRKN